MKQRVDVPVLAQSLSQDTKTQLVQALHYAQLLIPQGHNSVQDALNTLCPSLQALPQDGSSPTSRPQHYSGQHGQDAKVQTKPHSWTLAVNVKDFKTFAQPLVLLDLPR